MKQLNVHSPVQTTIRQTTTLSNAEKQQLFEWGDDIWEAAHLNVRWRPKDVHFILDVDDVPASHVGVVKHEIAVDEQPVLVGGVGGVATIPPWQKHGFARELMKQAIALFEDWQVKAGFLFCLPSRIAFYESQGWLLIRRPVMVEQPQGEIVSPLEVMVLPLGGYCWPDGDVRLMSFPW